MSRHASRRRPPAILLALLLCLCACAADKAQWAEAEVAAGSERILRQVGALALEKAGFPGGVQSEADGQLTSGWDVSLAPFKGDGWRERATVRLEPAAEGRFRVGVRVERERNHNMVSPLDLARAEWRSDGENEERARLVLQFMRSLLGPAFEAGEPRRRRAPG